MAKKSTKQSNEVFPAREGLLAPGMPIFVTEGTDTEQRLAIKLRVARNLKTLRLVGINPKSTDAEIAKEASDFAKTVVLTNIIKSTKG